jgi:protein TonB
MDNERKTFSWSTSLLIHAAVAAIIIKTSMHYALPEGDVVSIDVGSGNQGVQTAAKTDSQEVDVKAPPEKSEPKPMVAAAMPAKAPKPVEEKPEAQPLEQENSPVVIPPPPEEPQEEAKAEESPTPEPENEPPVVAPLPPDERPEEPQQEKPQQEEAQNETPHDDVPAGPVVANPEATGANAEAPPKFGTPGTTIDESKLTPKAGNKEVRYPWMARMKRQEGTVVVGAYVRKDGTISHAMIVKSSGHEALDKEVMETYPKWRFQPGPSGWVVKPYHFHLKK